MNEVTDLIQSITIALLAAPYLAVLAMTSFWLALAFWLIIQTYKQLDKFEKRITKAEKELLQLLDLGERGKS